MVQIGPYELHAIDSGYYEVLYARAIPHKILPVAVERDIPYNKVSKQSPLFDPEWETAMPGVYNMNILVPNASISYKF